MICIDTSVFIEHFRKKNKKETLLVKLSEESNLFVTTITTYEIYRGGVAQIPYWEMIFEKMQILTFDEDASKVAAGLYNKLKSKNKLIALPDLYIASIAIHHNLTLATHNLRDFSRIPGLHLYTA